MSKEVKKEEKKDKSFIAQILTDVSKLPANIIGINLLLFINKEKRENSFIIVEHKGTSIIFQNKPSDTEEELTNNYSYVLIPADIVTKAPRSGIDEVTITKKTIRVVYGDRMELEMGVNTNISTSLIKRAANIIKSINSVEDKDWIKIDHDIVSRYGNVSRIVASKEGIVIGNEAVMLYKEEESDELIINNTTTIDAIRSVSSISKSIVHVATVGANLLSKNNQGDTIVINIVGNPQLKNSKLSSKLVTGAKTIIDSDQSITIFEGMTDKILLESKKITNKFGRVSKIMYIDIIASKVIIRLKSGSINIKQEMEVKNKIKLGNMRHTFTLPLEVVKFIGQIETIEKIKIRKGNTRNEAIIQTSEGVLLFATIYASKQREK